MLEIPERGWIDVKGEVRGATTAEGRGEKEKVGRSDLHLPLLSLALKNASPKPSTMKKVKPRVIRTELAVLVRQSPRLAKSVAPEWSYYERILPRSASCPRRDLSNRVYASNKDRDVATVKAKKLEASLESNIPTFVRSIGSKSDVNGASITIKVFEVEELSNPKNFESHTDIFNFLCVHTCLVLVSLLYPSLEPGRSVSVGWSKLCQSGAVELSLINTKFPSSPRVASTELMSFAVILVDHTTFCGAPPCVITRLPSRILSLAEAIAAEGSGATLFATQTTACGEMFLYQIPT
nr:B3 domain-containing protein At5g42700-like [Ipomoea batatas]